MDAPGRGPTLVAHFFRHESARLVATLVRRFGGARLDVIEDAVQAALVAALSTWKRDGVPDNPSAWLTRVANNNVLDQLRREKTAGAWPGDERVSLVSPADPAPSPRPALEQSIADDELRMLFVCCDEQLTNETRLALSLKFVCGFGVREIAARLFLTEANAQKILERGRARLREVFEANPDADLLAPPAPSLEARLGAVQNVIYLLFNEGYSALDEHVETRREVCDEAVRLASLLVHHPATQTATSWALLALLELHASRFDARVGNDGQLLLLDQQDRSRWDRQRIARGLECLWRSGSGETFSRFHAEAAVLAEHCMAPSFAETRWSEIVAMYELLETQQPSPLHTLNRAIALAEWKGAEAGLALLRATAPPRWLAGYYLWDATQGELLRRLGRFAEAERHLGRAHEQAPTRTERNQLARRLERCRAGDAER